MSQILAIDPGPSLSAFALLREDGWPVDIGITDNESLLHTLRWSEGCIFDASDMAIEMVACYGMPVGAEVFDTCVWIGKFAEAWSGGGDYNVHYVFRKDVKMNLCNNMRAKDSNIRQALIDRYGGKEKGVGKKDKRGPLYGAKKDIWAAIAVGVTFLDKEEADGRLRETGDSTRREVEV
jgi:hypothetical protein